MDIRSDYLAERKKNKQLEELKKQGKTVYSISRINSFNTCQYGYYRTYILRDRGKNNVYGIAGSEIHDAIEEIYLGEDEKDSMSKRLEDLLFKCDIMGIDFPSENIKNNWVNDMKHFANNFDLIDKKVATEELVIYEIADGIYLQGYIDAIFKNNDKTVDIIDWKTSSKFTGKKLKEAGRQLLIYKEALENTKGLKVKNIAWYMFKYVNVCSKYKNGKTKRKMCNRRRWVKEISKDLKKDLDKLGNEDFIIEMLVDKAIEDNNLKDLPQEIQDKYWLEDCMVYYDYTDKNIKECKDYIINTIKEIEDKDKKDINDWKPVNINRGTEFFCKNLCGHRDNCPYLQDYLIK